MNARQCQTLCFGFLVAAVVTLVLPSWNMVTPLPGVKSATKKMVAGGFRYGRPFLETLIEIEPSGKLSMV